MIEYFWAAVFTHKIIVNKEIQEINKFVVTINSGETSSQFINRVRNSLKEMQEIVSGLEDKVDVELVHLAKDFDLINFFRGYVDTLNKIK